MKTLERIILIIIFLALCSLSFSQEKPSLTQDDRVKIQKPKMGKKKIKEQDLPMQELAAFEKQQTKFLETLSPEEKKQALKEMTGMSVAEKKQYMAEWKRSQGEHIDGVQRGKPEVDKDKGGNGEIDGVQRGVATSTDKVRTISDLKNRNEKVRAHGEALQERHRKNQLRLEQAMERFERERKAGTITEQEYGEKMERLKRINERMTKVQTRSHQQGERLKSIEIPTK